MSSAACAPCVFGAASSSLLSFPYDLKTVSVQVNPVVTVLSGGSKSTSYQTSTLTEAGEATATSAVTFTHTSQLVWETLGTTLTYPTTYVQYLAFEGAAAAEPTGCANALNPKPLNLGTFTDPASFVYPATGATALPAPLLNYLDGDKALASQLNGDAVASCAPLMDDPTFVPLANATSAAASATASGTADPPASDATSSSADPTSSSTDPTSAAASSSSPSSTPSPSSTTPTSTTPPVSSSSSTPAPPGTTSPSVSVSVSTTTAVSVTTVPTTTISAVSTTTVVSIQPVTVVPATILTTLTGTPIVVPSGTSTVVTSVAPPQGVSISSSAPAATTPLATTLASVTPVPVPVPVASGTAPTSALQPSNGTAPVVPPVSSTTSVTPYTAAAGRAFASRNSFFYEWVYGLLLPILLW